MSAPTNRAAYGSYFDLLDRALDTEAGIRIECSSQGEAYQYRVKLHSARKIDRKLNRESRSPDDPFFGTSDYDKLIVRTQTIDGRWWIYIEPVAIPNNIEELPVCKSDATATSSTIGPKEPTSPALSVEQTLIPILPLGPTRNTR